MRCQGTKTLSQTSMFTPQGEGWGGRAPVDELHRVDGRDALGGEVHRAPGVGAGDDVGGGAPDRAELAGADLIGQLGLEDRVGPAGATAQSVVVQFDQLADVRGEHGARREMDALHVAEVARILHGDTQVERCGGRESLDVQRQPFLDVVHPLRELLRFARFRADGRSPSSPRRSRPNRR